MTAIENLLDTSAQRVTSAKTSINHIPSLFKKIKWVPFTRNLDLGGGKFLTATEYLDKVHKVTNLIYDPFNCPRAEGVQYETKYISNNMAVLTISTLLSGINE